MLAHTRCSPVATTNAVSRIVTERYSETLAIDVYSIPAADLESLGK
jgi:hypothetical protein